MNCQVSVIVNRRKPYKQSTQMPVEEESDFSLWNFVPTSDYPQLRIDK
jgi:hypothetical protein